MKDGFEIPCEKHSSISTCRLVNQELLLDPFIQILWSRSGSDHFHESGLALHHLPARVSMGAIDETMIRTQFAEILEISVKSFPQGVQIHVIFKKRVKPAHGNERLLRPFRLLELRRIASSKNGQGQHGEHDQEFGF